MIKGEGEGMKESYDNQMLEWKKGRVTEWEVDLMRARPYDRKIE